MNIQWLEQRLPALTRAPVPEEELRLAAVAAALLAHRDRGVRPTRTAESRATNHDGAESRVASEDNDAWRRAARLDALR